MRLLDSAVVNNFTIECDEIDGVVFGSWTNVNENPSGPMVDEDNAYAGYWAAAAVWFSFYDQRSVDRVSHFLYIPCLTLQARYTGTLVSINTLVKHTW